MTTRPIAFINARLVDPASGYDGPGALMASDGRIVEVTHGDGPAFLSPDVRRIDCQGAMLAPGLIDLRVKTGEPGAEPKETLKSAARAAAAGGVTSIVVQPDTDPAIDDPSVVDFILRRARDIELVHVYPAGAATKGLAGQQMAELGLMHEAGCVYVTDADRPIVDSKVMRRLLSYAKGQNLLVAHRPADPWLTDGAAATESEFAGRMGLPAAPAVAEKIMLERDAARSSSPARDCWSTRSAPPARSKAWPAPRPAACRCWPPARSTTSPSTSSTSATTAPSGSWSRPCAARTTARR